MILALAALTLKSICGVSDGYFESNHDASDGATTDDTLS
jgi:hypothetical protein